MDFRNGYFGASTCNALTEQINKETKLRMTWNEKYNKYKELYGNSTAYTWNSMYESMQKEEERKRRCILPEIKVNNQKRDHTNEINEYLQRIQVKDLNSSKLYTTEMYPIDNKLKHSLFDGISYDQLGRKKYLKERHKTKPESRYKFPVCASMDVGWRLNDIRDINDSFLYIKPEFANRNEIYNAFYRNNGVFEGLNEKIVPRRPTKKD